MGELSIDVRSLGPDETRKLGERLGRSLIPGAIVLLVGELGAGKTVLARGIARGLGVPDEAWAGSPSFIIVQRYAGRLALAHVDLYRIRAVEEFSDLGWEEVLGGEGVAVIEWGDRFPALVGDGAIRVEIILGEGDDREIRVTASGEPGRVILEGLAAAGMP